MGRKENGTRKGIHRKEREKCKKAEKKEEEMRERKQEN